jgi:hypothetical protein
MSEPARVDSSQSYQSPFWARRLVSRLIDAAVSKRTGRCLANPKPAMDKVLAEYGGRVRMGDGDAKTAAPGTYRGVGNTCGLDCEHHPGNAGSCYADSGNVGLHSEDAKGRSATEAVNAFAAAVVWALLTERKARIHVSGDFGVDDGDAMTGSKVDWDYVGAIADVASAARYLLLPEGDSVVAWTYTAFTGEDGARIVSILADAGVSCRLSGFAGPNGAITAPFAVVPGLRKEFDTRIAKCPAQLTHTTCAECTLSRTRRARSVRCAGPVPTWRLPSTLTGARQDATSLAFAPRSEPLPRLAGLRNTCALPTLDS